MDYVVEKMNGFKVIGFERVFASDTSYKDIPAFWTEIFQTYCKKMMENGNAETPIEQCIRDNSIGTYGICIDDLEEKNQFRYIIGGAYTGGAVPEGMTLYEFPDIEWAKFDCVGPMPHALQAVNTKIFKEWLPGNPDYEIALGANIEWYSDKGNTTDVDYKSAIWIPVKKRS